MYEWLIDINSGLYLIVASVIVMTDGLGVRSRSSGWFQGRRGGGGWEHDGWGPCRLD